MLERDDCNLDWQAERLDGYPITLKVPTHIRLTVYDKYYLVAPPSADAGKPAKGWVPLELKGHAVKHRAFSTELIETEKIFTVDHRRPGAGSMQYGVNFSEDQYIADMKSRTVDDTIRQTSIALERAVRQVAGLGNDARATGDATATLSGELGLTTKPEAKKRPDREEDFAGGPDVFAEKEVQIPRSVVCTQIFEVDDPELESKLLGFLETAF